MSTIRVLSAAGALALLASTALAQTPPAAETTPAAPPAAAAPAGQGDVVATLKARGQFTTFLKALDAAGMSQPLANAKAITLFAPTDAAFAALPPGTVDEWLKPENVDKLRQVLMYHTIMADVSSKQVVGTRGPVPTGAEKTVLLDGTGGKIKANDANVVTADIRATNGAIFAIDKVLDPATAPAAASGS